MQSTDSAQQKNTRDGYVRDIMRYSRVAWQTLINVILPPRCPVTGDLVGQQGTVAPAFWAQLNFIQNPLCDCCGLPFTTPEAPGTLCGHCIQDPPAFTHARSALYYDEASARLILPFKHGDRTLTAPLLAQWLIQAAGRDLSAYDFIVPVPLHRWRLLKRRYNQAGELARALSVKTRVPWLSHTLQRHRPTASQGHKPAAARHDNVHNAFRITSPNHVHLKNKTIILIDDVYTTGATIRACCKTLLKAGVKEILVLTLARVARPT